LSLFASAHDNSKIFLNASASSWLSIIKENFSDIKKRFKEYFEKMKTKVRLEINHRLHNCFNLNTDGLEEKLIALKRDWGKIERKVLNGLEKITGLCFVKNYMDVYLINPDNRPSISSPTIVKFQDSANRTICIMIHELIHNLMWDNVQKNNWSIKVQKLFKNENRKTAIHIAVHAILEAVYTNILKKPEEITQDINEMQKYPDYKRAWEIVKKEGYQNIIDKLKSSK